MASETVTIESHPANTSALPKLRQLWDSEGESFKELWPNLSVNVRTGLLQSARDLLLDRLSPKVQNSSGEGSTSGAGEGSEPAKDGSNPEGATMSPQQFFLLCPELADGKVSRLAESPNTLPSLVDIRLNQLDAVTAHDTAYVSSNIQQFANNDVVHSIVAQRQSLMATYLADVIHLLQKMAENSSQEYALNETSDSSGDSTASAVQQLVLSLLSGGEITEARIDSLGLDEQTKNFILKNMEARENSAEINEKNAQQRRDQWSSVENAMKKLIVEEAPESGNNKKRDEEAKAKVQSMREEYEKELLQFHNASNKSGS